MGSVLAKDFLPKIATGELKSAFPEGQSLLEFYNEHTTKVLYWRAYKGIPGTTTSFNEYIRFLLDNF